jgi:hypothetical protein
MPDADLDPDALGRWVDQLGAPAEVAAINRRSLERFAAKADSLVLGVPGEAGRVVWYGVAPTPVELAGLRELLLAAVGPSYTDFHGELTALRDGVPIERALGRRFGPQAMRLDTGGRPDDERETLRALTRLQTLREREPTLAPAAPEAALAADLRGFYAAVQAGRRADAEERLVSLGEGQQLSESDLLRLRVQLLAALAAWRELLGLSDLGLLIQSPQPPAVTQALLRAFYRERLEPYEREAQYGTARQVFAAEVLPRAAPLLRAYTGLEHPECGRLFLYLAVHREDRRLRDEIIARWAGTAADDSAFRATAAALDVPPIPVPPPAPAEATTAAAQAALEEGDVDRAYRQALELPASAARAVVLLECADIIRTVEATEAVREAFQGLALEERERVLRHPRRRRVLEELLATFGGQREVPLPRDWLEWFTRLEERGDLDLEQIAVRGAAEWDPDRVRPAEAARLADYLTRAWPPAALETLWLALPHLVAFLHRAGAPHPYRPVHLALLDLLAIEGRCGQSDLEMIADLVRVVFDGGFDVPGERQQYEQVVTQLGDVWERVRSARFLPWLLDVVELVADYPPMPGTDGCLPLLRKLTALPPAILARLSAADWGVLRGVCERVGGLAEYEACRAALPAEQAAAVAEAEESDEAVWARLTGTVIGIYTLWTAIGQNARREILHHCPECEVLVNDDKVETADLRAMAQRADLVIVAWRVAKHAATESINRLRDRQGIRYAEGRGVSSILRQVREYAAALVPIELG